MRDAKLEAMGLRPDDHEYRRSSDRTQMATDEIVRVHCMAQHDDTDNYWIRLWKDLRRVCVNEDAFCVRTELILHPLSMYTTYGFEWTPASYNVSRAEDVCKCI